MAADLQEQAVQVEWKAAKITAAALKGLIEKILANREKITHGEQSLKKLNLQGKKLESIELTGEDILPAKLMWNRRKRIVPATPLSEQTESQLWKKLPGKYRLMFRFPCSM